MSELSPRYSGTGFIEQALADSSTEVELSALLEDVFPRDYNGDESIPLDASPLALCHGIVERIWTGHDEGSRQAMFTIFYRALEFAYNTTATLKPSHEDIIMDIETTFSDLHSSASQDIANEIYEKGIAYLVDRPVLDALVRRFAGSVSPHPSCDYVTVAICGVWLKSYDDGYEISKFRTQIEDII